MSNQLDPRFVAQAYREQRDAANETCAALRATVLMLEQSINQANETIKALQARIVELESTPADDDDVVADDNKDHQE